MGQLVEGTWVEGWYEPDAKGRFVRGRTTFRDRVSADGSTPFPAEAGRYRLYVSLACPWAHRTLIARKVRRLEDVIAVSVVNDFMGPGGWSFDDGPGVVPDPVLGARYLHQLYVAARPDYTGRVTVPVLWDEKTGTIVNNESREILEQLDEAFAALGDPEVRLYPPELRAQIDRTIDAIYEPINNGVYKAGFATTQEAYEEAVTVLFEALDHWDGVLERRRYLCGPRITAADWCLFTTLLRFDPVYYGHFKCNRRHIYEYPHLGPYLRDLYQQPGVAETCDFGHIKRHYYRSHDMVNPTRIVPVGPDPEVLALHAPHGREALA